MAWDRIAKRDVPIGARRWTVEWGILRDGHDGGDDCSDHFIEECYTQESRSFPDRGLALAFARKVEHPRLFFGARIAEEVFDDDDGEGNRTGYAYWERVGEYEEVC